MKTIIPCLAVLLAAVPSATADTKAQLRKAIFAEEVEQDPVKAAAIYRRMIDQSAEGPRHLAIARYRLAKLHLAADRRADAIAGLNALVTDANAPADWVVEARKLIDGIQPKPSAEATALVHDIHARIKDKVWYWHAGKNLHGEPFGALKFLADGKVETTIGLEWVVGWAPMGGDRFKVIQIEGKYWVHELSKDGSETSAIAFGGAVDAEKRLSLHPSPERSVDEVEIEFLKQLLERQPDAISAWKVPCKLARTNRTKSLGFLLDRGIDVDFRERDSVRYTPLMYAAEYGNLETVRFLLDRGADVNALDKRNLAPLYIAASRGDAGIVSLLIDRGADLTNTSPFVREADQRLDHGTALHGAVQRGHLEVVKLLLDRGADINAVSPGKFLTPLICALALKDFRMADELLVRGADPNLPATGISNPLRQMAYQGNLPMLRKLLDRGARVDMQSDEIREHSGVSRTVGAALPAAAREGHLEISKMLVEAGCPVDQTSPIYLETPLHAAALHGNTAMCQWLIGKGAKIDHRLPDEIDFQAGWTALHSAAWGESLDVMKLLMEKGASPEVPCGDRGLRRTAFHLAVLKGWLPLVTGILDQAAYQNPESRQRLLAQTDSEGNSALHLAVSREAKPNAELVRLLIDSGAPRALANKYNQTPRDLSLDPDKGTRDPGVKVRLNP